MTETELEQLCVNVVRGLAMDGLSEQTAVTRAQRWRWRLWLTSCSRGCFATTRESLTGPTGPVHPVQRSRVHPVYSMLLLNGYGISLKDIEQFRHWGSPTAGHRRSIRSPGSRSRPAPWAGLRERRRHGGRERFLRSHFGPETIDHHIFVICGDGT